MKEAIVAKLSEMGMTVHGFSKSEQAVKMFGDKAKHIPAYLSTSEATSVSFPFMQRMYVWLEIGTLTRYIKRETTTKFFTDKVGKPKPPRRRFKKLED